MDACSLRDVWGSVPVRRARDLFRRFNASRAVPWLALAALLCLARGLLAGHVFWRDEAHALLLVHANPALGDLLRALTYEGSPFLWHLGLWLAAKLGVLTPERMQALHFLAVAVLVILVLWLPRVTNTVRLMMLFQVPMLEYFTYSRQYLLVLVALFAFAHLWLRNRRSPWLCVALFLMGQISAHGCLLSLGLLGFLVGESWLAGARKFRFAWLLPVAGAALCHLQMRMPPDIIEGHRRWRPIFAERTVGFAEAFARDLLLKDALAGAFFAGFALLALFVASRRDARRAGLAAAVVAGMAAGFFLVGATKYSCPRHHWLLSYSIFVLAVMLVAPCAPGRWSRGMQALALGALLFGGCRFVQGVRFQSEALSSHSANVAAWLDRRYPERVVLAAHEHYYEPVMVYRKVPGRVFALGRQGFIRHVVWNHPSIDFSQGDGLQMRPLLSALVRDLREVPREILDARPVVVFGFDGLQKGRGESAERIPVAEGWSLRLEQVFSGAMHENYLAYVLEQHE